jgi:hypothetical protein
MERHSQYTCHAALSRCLMVLSMVAALQSGSVILADERQASEMTPNPTSLSELFVESVSVEPDDVASESSQPPVAEPAQPTPAEESPPLRNYGGTARLAS